MTPPKCSCNPYSISTPSDRLVQGSSSGSQHIYAHIVQAIILIHSENMGSYNRPIVNMVIYKYYSNLGNKAVKICRLLSACKQVQGIEYMSKY